jgi:putative ABC transport system permease protein
MALLGGGSSFGTGGAGRAPAGRLRRGFRSLLWRPDLEDEIADELAFHAEMLARDYAARGMAPAQATLAARRRLGDLGAVKAACRAVGRGRDRARRRAMWLGETLQDLRLAGRRLGQRRGSTLVAVLALAAGLAGVATAWQLARAVERPLPFAEPASLVRLRQLSPEGAAYAATRDAYADWRRLCGGCAALAAYETTEVNLAAGNRPANMPGVPAIAAAPANQPGVPLPAMERVTAGHATASLLPLLGVRPWLGRGFTVGEAARRGDHRVAVLSYSLWQRIAVAAGALSGVGAAGSGVGAPAGGGAAGPAGPAGGEVAVLGGILRVDGAPLRIIGVMPAGFAVPGTGSAALLWTPLAAARPTRRGNDDHHRLEVLARLRPGVAPRRAMANLADLKAASGRVAGATRGWSVQMEPLAAAWTMERWSRRARLLLAAAGLLWLLASVSAANLLWAQATARQREIDLRAVLGGGRGRLVRQLLAEGLLVAVLGAVAGLLLAGFATTALRRAALELPALASLAAPGWPAALASPAAPASPALPSVSSVSAPSALAAPSAPFAPSAGEPLAAESAETGHAAAAPRLDFPTAALMLGLALLSCLGCGLGPALQVLRPGLHEAVRQAARLTTRGEHRVSEVLLVAEIAVATTLAVAAGLLLLSVHRLGRADPGFDADHLLSMRLSLDGAPYPPARRRVFVSQLEERLGRLPGVAAAGVISTAPLAAESPGEPFALAPVLPARPGLSPRFATAAAVEWRVASPGAFRALALRRIAGRLPGPGDLDGHLPVAVVDAALASRAWPGAGPLGRRLRWAPGRRDLTVVGVVDGLSDLDVEAAPGGAVFVPYALAPWRAMALVVRPRAGAGGAALAAAVRREIAALDPALPVSAPRFLDLARRQAVAAPRLGSWLLALYAAAALVLAISGVYATAAAAVARRTAEIAVRQALGAAGRDVLHLVLARTALLTSLGLACGLGGALLARPLLAGLLFQTSAAHAATYAAAALLVGTAAVLASALPARRAARIPPALALRRE